MEGLANASDNSERRFVQSGKSAEEPPHETLERRRAYMGVFTIDQFYVTLNDSAQARARDKIYEALDSVDGPPIILLHGEAGIGKSSVARETVARYSQQNRLDHVFLLNCGPHVRIEDIHFELTQRLGSQPLASIHNHERTGSSPIRKQIEGLLEERNVVLILDDVSDGEFVREILELCGRGVKCVITSQLGSLCRNLDSSKFISIEVQDIDEDDARQILSSQVSLRENKIPTRLQKIAEGMICETGLNPLAIVSLASMIDHKRTRRNSFLWAQDRPPLLPQFAQKKENNQSQDLKDWEDASETFFRALKFEVPATPFQGTYPRSLWATMRINISTLNDDAVNLLLLTHACEGPSVPEEVIQALFTSIQPQENSRPFSTITRELGRRELIKVSELTSIGVGKNTTWEVHSLQKQFIVEEMRDAGDLIFNALLSVAGSTMPAGENRRGNEMGSGSTATRSGNVQISVQPEGAVITALCALYLDKHLACEAAAKMGFPLEHFSKQKRNAIEPVTRLLALPVSDEWTATARDCATKVFLNYVCNSALDTLNMSELLRNSTGAIAMCRALRAIAVIEEKTLLLDESCGELMKALVNNLSGIWIESIRKIALEVIAGFAHNEINSMFIVSFPEALDGIVSCLEESYYSALKHRAGTLPPHSDLLGVENPYLERRPKRMRWRCRIQLDRSEVSRRLLWSENQIARMVVGDLSFSTEEPNFEDYGAHVLSRLAFGGDEIKIKIASHPGMLRRLAWLLQRQQRASGIAAYTLMTLALPDNEMIRECVKATQAESDESVINGLVSLVEGAPNGLRHGPRMLDFYYREREYFAMVALTMFDPNRGNQLVLHSGLAYGGRGHANLVMGSTKDALHDLLKAHEMEPQHSAILRDVGTLRAKMGDLQEALEDNTIETQELRDTACRLQERGALESMMGAVEDLNV